MLRHFMPYYIASYHIILHNMMTERAIADTEESDFISSIPNNKEDAPPSWKLTSRNSKIIKDVQASKGELVIDCLIYFLC